MTTYDPEPQPVDPAGVQPGQSQPPVQPGGVPVERPDRPDRPDRDDDSSDDSDDSDSSDDA